MTNTVEHKVPSKIKSLADHIQEHYNGNQSAFGRSHGLSRQEVYQYLNAKKPVFVVDGQLVQVIKAKKKP